MSNYKIQNVSALHDPTTGALMGFLGADGQEYLMPALDAPGAGFVDSSATPGNVTNNAVKGKAAFAAGANSVIVTNNRVTANSVVVVTQVTTDATLNNITNVAPGAGSFTVTGNANATGTPAFNFVVLN